MNPTYRIYYGKYIDGLTNEIPTEHIEEVSGLTFKMEPGKPAEPTIDQVDFTLKNLNYLGEEMYSRTWFEDNSRTQSEGAIVPLQLFFRIEMPDYGNRGFTGVLRSKKYGGYRETVRVTIKDPLDLVKEGSVFMLKSFSFEEATYIDGSLSGIPLPMDDFNPNGYDLNDDPINAENLFFTTERTDFAESWGEVEVTHPYFLHKGYDDVIANHTPTWTQQDVPQSPLYYDIIDSTVEKRSVWIKISENTILTTINEYIVAFRWGTDPNADYWARYYCEIVHANNGNASKPEGGTILERGRFFKDGEGTQLSDDDEVTITIFDYNAGNDNDILVDESHIPTTKFFYHGCEVDEDFPSSGEYTINETGVSWFDVLAKVVEVFNESLYTIYFDNTSSIDLFDQNKVEPYTDKHAFWADLLTYNWLDTEPTEILINLAMQLNCYLYFNADGKIAFHDRDWHDQYLPDALPPNTFEVQLSDIEPLGDYEEDHGFDSFKIETIDRIPINNVEASESITEYVDENGVRNTAALRSTDLDVQNYRTDDLGVPTANDPTEMPKFRFSPNETGFGGTANVTSLTQFLPTPAQQAQRFAESWSYPTTLWKIQWDMPKYPAAAIGGYFWVHWPPYFTTEIIDVDTSGNAVTVNGNRENVLDAGSPFDIEGSTGNDGSYTVFTTIYDEGNDTTEIVANEAIGDASVNGNVVAVKNLVYIIREITHDMDGLKHKMEVQEIGEYIP